MATRLIVAAVASDEPEIAANMPQARTVAIASPAAQMPEERVGRAIDLTAQTRPVDEQTHQDEERHHA
jgi:transcriptional/translational regulatory protein YebC/TACO1